MSLWTWNVKLTIVLCFVSGVADSIWIDTVLSSFLFGLARLMGQEAQQNTLVGWGEAAWGVSQLVFALPIGYLADKWSKAKTLRAGSFVMLATIVLTAWAVQRGADAEDGEDDSKQKAEWSYDVLIVSMVAWGVVGGLSNGPAQAVFADAIPAHLRAEGYTYLMCSYMVAYSVGPIVSIVLFSRLSNQFEDWNLKEIRPVFLTGLALEIFAAICMMFFKDYRVSEDGKQVVEENGESTGMGEKAVKYDRKIPLLLFLSSLTTALGSGASVKYFPLFFKELGLSPEKVQWIFVFSPLLIALFTFLAKFAGERFGSIKSAVILESTGAGLFMMMSFCHYHGMETPAVMIPLYLLRTAFLNCTYPIVESVLMSNVDPKERSRWKALESIAAFSWTGSAVLGGFLSDKKGYAFAFGISAAFQMLGAWMMIPLISMVREELKKDTPPTATSPAPVLSATVESTTTVDDVESHTLSEPLLESGM